MKKAVLAIAIEDRVDVWFQNADGEVFFKSDPEIPEGRNYLEEVHRLIREQFQSLLVSLKLDAASLFDSIASIVVSIPGVIEKDVLLQIPLWHSKSFDTACWKHNGELKTCFDFPNELADIVQSLIEKQGLRWNIHARKQFADRVLAVNDATAGAIFECDRRLDLGMGPQDARDFIYVKIHEGMNVGVVKSGSGGKIIVPATHPEAGHSYAEPHELDFHIFFQGICRFHRGCFEGMIAVHGIYKRAMSRKKASNPKHRAVLDSWKKKALALRRKKLRGHQLDDALLQAAFQSGPLTKDGTNYAVDLIAHYAAGLIYQLMIGPLAPKQVVIGGPSATEPVLIEIRKKVRREFAHGYPARPELSAQEIDNSIVRVGVAAEEVREIEVRGALAMANSEACESATVTDLADARKKQRR